MLNKKIKFLLGDYMPQANMLDFNSGRDGHFIGLIQDYEYAANGEPMQRTYALVKDNQGSTHVIPPTYMKFVFGEVSALLNEIEVEFDIETADKMNKIISRHL